MKSLERRARGYVLLMVLVVLLVLTLLVAGLYSASEDSRFTAQTMMAQRIASARADQAAQLAIATVRAGTVSASSLLPWCSFPEPSSGAILRAGGDCTTGAYVTSGRISGGICDSSGGPENGRGILYQWWIYKQGKAFGVPPDDQAAEVFNIYAEGYAGCDSVVPANSPIFTVSAVQAEVTIPGDPSGSGSGGTGTDYGG